ncbi:ComEC/Rec2 family competence protein, partial [Flavobacterium sp. B17]|uniref:ComEC/Rec2 family competence protein n=1 Tax=Flavobacterium sp. B17 TaxID=95618 RepID=UPI0005B2EAE1
IVFNTISISISAQLATLPLVLYYFHQFSFISIVANFFIVPFSEIIIVFSFVMTTLIAFHLDIGFVNIAYDFIIRLLLNIIHWFADFDTLFFENIPMNLLEILILYIIFYLLRAAVLKFNIKNVTGIMMVISAFLILRTSFDYYESLRAEVLVHDFSKNKLISVKKNEAVCFWIKKNSDKQKVTNFIINPYCASRRLKSFEIRTLPDSVQKVVYRDKIFKMN